VIEVAREVARAIKGREPVVALETTLVAHGFPAGEGIQVALEAEQRVRDAGALPATVGVMDGAIRVGLSKEQLERFTVDARKVGPRDLAACVVQGAIGATTVGGTLAACRAAGIGFMATGGIGGVHRGDRIDISGDLGELARVEALVVCSGAKSFIDVAATMELLETLGVPVLGYRTDELPLFYAAQGGPPVPARVESAAEAAEVARTHWGLRRHSAVLLAQPPPETLDEVEPLIDQALAAAGEQDVSGPRLTPFVLSFLHERSGGATLRVNRELVLANAGLAAEVAVAFARMAG
jgi:pseudouridine-5'-phosphate glycosidase